MYHSTCHPNHTKNTKNQYHDYHFYTIIICCQIDKYYCHFFILGLLSELEEIRAQREQTGLQSDHVSRLQTRQLTEHVATIKALEVSLDSRVFGENMQILKKGVGSVFCAVNACFNNKGFMY